MKYKDFKVGDCVRYFSRFQTKWDENFIITKIDEENRIWDEEEFCEKTSIVSLNKLAKLLYNIK